MRPPKKILLVSILLVGIALGFLWLMNGPSSKGRRGVDYWVHGHRWWNRKLSHKENGERQRRGITNLGPAAVPLLIEDLNRPDSVMSDLNRALQQLLRSPARAKPNPRCEAAYALEQFGPAARAAVPPLIAIAQSGDWEEQPTAIRVLGAIAGPDTNVISALSLLAKSGRCSLAAEISLCRLQPGNVAASNAVAARIASATTLNNNAAFAQELIWLGTNAQPFVPSLRVALTNKGNAFGSELVGRMFIAQALWNIEKSSDASLFALATLTNGVATGVAPRADLPGNLLWITSALKDIPEFCAAAKPLVQSLDVRRNRELANIRSNLLKEIEQTLVSARTNTVQAATNAP